MEQQEIEINDQISELNFDETAINNSKEHLTSIDGETENITSEENLTELSLNDRTPNGDSDADLKEKTGCDDSEMKGIEDYRDPYTTPDNTRTAEIENDVLDNNIDDLSENKSNTTAINENKDIINQNNDLKDDSNLPNESLQDKELQSANEQLEVCYKKISEHEHTITTLTTLLNQRIYESYKIALDEEKVKVEKLEIKMKSLKEKEKEDKQKLMVMEEELIRLRSKNASSEPSPSRMCTIL